MGVLEEIRKVERPNNTVVVVYGKNGDKYVVRSRIGCRYENGRWYPRGGRHSRPHHRREVRSRGRGARVDDCGVDLKDWANVDLLDFLSKGVLGELEAVYSRKDAQALYCMALLRTSTTGSRTTS